MLPVSVTIKFDLYSLACHELCKELKNLRTSTSGDETLPYTKCLEIFNESLKHFFKRSPANDKQEAAEQLTRLLRTEAGFFQNKKVAQVFERVANSVFLQARSWSYRDIVESFNDLGCTLARRFYESIPCDGVQERLHRKCLLHYKYTQALTETLMGYHESYEGFEDVILVRFTFDHDLVQYLAYPFLFLHEYTAHVYALDYGCNDRFHDGWLMHAAASFLEREWIRTFTDFGLNFEQTQVFYMSLFPRALDNPSCETCVFARHLESFLGSHKAKMSFLRMTCELAAFKPQGDEKEFWPTIFIRTLENEFRGGPSHRQKLLKKFQVAEDVRSLLTLLS